MMKRKLSFRIVLFVIALPSFVQMANGQDKNDESNGTLQIIKICAPDSVVFTLAKGKTIDYVNVHLIGKGQELEGTTYVSGSIHMKMVNGETVFTYNDKSRITTKWTDIPSDFKAEQVRFKTDQNVMYYNITGKRWE